MSDVTDQRLTAVRQVSTKGWRVRRGEGGGEGKMEWILICLQQPGCPPPLDHTEGRNAWRIPPMVWPRQNTHCASRSRMV